MDEKEFMRETRVDWPNMNVFTVLDACEARYLNGQYDDISGDSEAPTGHFYLVERWIVVTDSQGFRHLHTYHSVLEAEAAFEQMDEAYAEWEDE
jgi:hypothetical protein